MTMVFVWIAALTAGALLFWAGWTVGASRGVAANRDLPIEAVLDSQSDETEARRNAIFAKVFNLVPETLTITRIADGRFMEVSRNWEALTGYTYEEAIGHTSAELGVWVVPEQREHIVQSLGRDGEVRDVDVTFLHKQGHLYYTKVSGAVFDLGGQKYMMLTVHNVTAQREARQQILELNATLEQRVQTRTAELEAANRELEAFSYSVSHDLRAPLRAIDGFARALEEDYADRMDGPGCDYLARVRKGARRMNRLIDDMLELSRVSRAEMRLAAVDLSAMATEIAEQLAASSPGRDVAVAIAPGVAAQGDDRLIHIALTNLLGNAWKYTGRTEAARIELGARQEQGETVYFVRDNGAGFDMGNADKLFGVFQRLHRREEFEGTGVGLATVQRIVRRHGGRVWAEAALGRGATFHFTLSGGSPDTGHLSMTAE